MQTPVYYKIKARRKHAFGSNVDTSCSAGDWMDIREIPVRLLRDLWVHTAKNTRRFTWRTDQSD